MVPILVSEGLANTIIGGVLVLLGTVANPFISQISKIYKTKHEENLLNRKNLKFNVNKKIKIMLNVIVTLKSIKYHYHDRRFSEVENHDKYKDILNQCNNSMQNIDDYIIDNILDLPKWIIKNLVKFSDIANEISNFYKNEIIQSTRTIDLSKIEDKLLMIQKIHSKTINKSRAYFGTI